MQLPVSPARAAEHLPGRYIHFPGWDSRLSEGGGPSPRSHSSFPSLAQRPGPISRDRKTLGRPPMLQDVSGRAPYPAPRELGSLDLENLLPAGSFIVLPPLTSTPSTPHPTPKPGDSRSLKASTFHPACYRGEEIASGFTSPAAERVAAGELPGRRPSCCGTCCFSLGLRAVSGWWRVFRGPGCWPLCASG